MTKYSVDKLLYSAAFYDSLNQFSWDIPFYLEQAKKARGRVLELCCGTGRITIPLAKAGIYIQGVDSSDSMLAGAKQKMREAEVRIPLIKGDMRTLRLGRKFNLIFIPFNSLQNTYSLTDVEKIFETVRLHLFPGGQFVFDIFNPNIHFMVKSERLQRNRYRFKFETRHRNHFVSIDEQCKYDSAGQVNCVKWFLRIDKKQAVEKRLDMRCFWPLEMDGILKYNGFHVIRKYGDFNKSPFEPDSPKQIFICETENSRLRRHRR